MFSQEPTPKLCTKLQHTRTEYIKRNNNNIVPSFVQQCLCMCFVFIYLFCKCKPKTMYIKYIIDIRKKKNEEEEALFTKYTQGERE